MKINIAACVLFFIALTGFRPAFAQSPEKFGKIDAKDLQLKYCPIDSNAHAYFVFDVGNTEFIYDQNGNKGFQMFFNRHFRIKIIDNQGLSWGDVKIPLYQSGTDREEVISLKAFTYNFENGQVTKTKLEKQDILTEETSENIKTCKLAMPNIKNGSVIEVEYKIKSDFLFNLQEWYFQRSIPMMHSEYEVNIPEYFNYNQTQRGFYPVKFESGAKRNSIIFTSKERTGTRVTTTEVSTSKIEFTEKTHHYLATNVPSFPDEKFLKTKDNYLTRVEFELQYTKFPDQPLKYFTTSWEEVDSKLNESYYFGKELGKTNHLKEAVASLKESGLQGENLLISALEHMKKKISWNGIRNKYLTATINKAYKDGEGNSADVNLNLVVLLRELGFESYPVVLSTQDNGIIHPSHPSLSRFNYVIALALTDGKKYLLDATDPNSMLNLIPIRCLNDKGRIIGNTPDKWVNLMDYKSYIAQTIYQVDLDSNLSFNGKTNKKLLGYAAYDYKSKVNTSNDVLKELESLEELPSFEVENIEIKNQEAQDDAFVFTYDLLKSSGMDNSAEMVYFAPTIAPFFNENPFKLEKREYPVEFNYPYTIQTVYTYTLPDNYEVAEIPEPIAVKLPDNGGNFVYQAQKLGNKLNISSIINIKKSLFLPEEYESIKIFFQHIIDKQNELVVLKSI